MRLALPFALLFVLPAFAKTRPPAPAVAMVADVGGDACVGDGSRPVALTQEVHAGVPLKLSPGATLTLLLYGTGETLRLAGPGTFTLQASGTLSGPKTGIHRTQGAGLNLKEALKPGGLAQASLVMRGPLDIDLEEPSQPVVRTARPAFRWVPVKGARSYVFTLRRAQGPVLITTSTPATRIDLPESIRLRSGVTYQWEVRTTLPGTHTLRSTGDLAVLDQARARKLNRLRAEARQSFAWHVIYASTLQIEGLLAEAKAEWRQLAAERPDDPVLQAYAR